MERLQPKMEERLAHLVPATGRFCAFCYGRLRAEDAVCPWCERQLAERGTVPDIPQEVLRAYRVKQRTESTWVYMGAFIGLILASILFIIVVIWVPGPLGHPAVGFLVLLGGGYFLAQLTGPGWCGPIGYERGVRQRDAMWEEFLRERDG
jgi:hypothetical protein